MTKDVLEEYFTISSRITAIDEEIRTLYLPQINAGGQDVDAGRVSSRMPHSKTEEAAIRILSLKERLQDERRRLLDLAETIETWLESVEDPEIEAIVRWHYLLRRNWKETNIKVYGYPSYWYARQRLERFFAKSENCSN